MLAIPYYYSLLKKYVIVFGTLFNQISIEHTDSDGNIKQVLRVPISYGPKEKFLARLEANPSGINKTSIRLPRMAFEISNIQYAPSRKLQTIQKIYQPTTIDGKETLKKLYTPVPYDISFNLYIMTKSTEDGARIVEQILPYFTPEWTVSARLIDGWDNYSDIPVVINNIQYDDQYEGDFTERRALVYTINFTLKGYLYGPQLNAKTIKISTIDFHVPIDIEQINVADPSDIVSSLEVRPGLDANGNPTTLLANTIPYSEIQPNNNFGYIVTKTDV